MIWSVSTSARSRWLIAPEMVSIASTGQRSSRSVPAPYVHEAPLDRGRGGHLGGDEMGAPAPPLAALEVAVGGRGAAFPGLQDVGVHPQAHRTPGRPPFEAGLGEDPVQSLL